MFGLQQEIFIIDVKKHFVIGEPRSKQLPEGSTTILEMVVQLYSNSGIMVRIGEIIY